MILLIDNYDSFSYNLYQLVGKIVGDAGKIKVIRNDEMTVSEIKELNPSHIIISPGPGRPADAGVIEEAIQNISGEIPILGVCLGHQAICEAFGAEIIYAKELMHGKQKLTAIDSDSKIFAGMPPEIPVARYHSLAANEITMPDCLKITARSNDREIMAVEHAAHNTFGLQFHPESIMTPDGEKIMRNFLKIKSA